MFLLRLCAFDASGQLGQGGEEGVTPGEMDPAPLSQVQTAGEDGGEGGAQVHNVERTSRHASPDVKSTPSNRTGLAGEWC